MEEASDDDGDDDVDGKDEEEEESDEEKPRPRGGKKNTKASARDSTVREKKNRGKGGKTKANTKTSRPSEANGDGKENGVSLGSQPADSKGREKKGRKDKKGKRNSQAAGGPSNKPNALNGNAVPLSDDAPAVSKSTNGGKTAGEGKPQRSPKDNGRGKSKSSATPAGEGDTTAMKASVAKRKHNVRVKLGCDWIYLIFMCSMLQNCRGGLLCFDTIYRDGGCTCDKEPDRTVT